MLLPGLVWWPSECSRKEIRPLYKIFSFQLDCSVDPVTGALMNRNFGNMIMFSEELFYARLKYWSCSTRDAFLAYVQMQFLQNPRWCAFYILFLFHKFQGTVSRWLCTRLTDGLKLEIHKKSVLSTKDPVISLRSEIVFVCAHVCLVFMKKYAVKLKYVGILCTIIRMLIKIITFSFIYCYLYLHTLRNILTYIRSVFTCVKGIWECGYAFAYVRDG